MSALDPKLRSQLDTVCQRAREKAEEAARSALQKRAVDAAEPYPHFTPEEKKLRNRLRARGRQVGDVRQADKRQDIEQLTQELAYEYWHRMLFARFLAENHLLMHPDGVAVSLEECEDLAQSQGAANGFALAARYASKMLPQVFRTDDVLLEIEFAPEHRLALEKLLAGIPRETFLADDSLGWVYQFWQSRQKDEVNKSGQKIDGRTLPAVTQLFTEDYMVQFLLQNTIGAWWCGRHQIKGPGGGAGIPAGKAPVEMPYLRWRDDGTPAAGTFDGWPESLKDFTVLDPCCGSGHFLVAAFLLLVPLRMRDEGLSARDACDAVLRENVYGLELDPRCTQIAAFAIALAAWRYLDESGAPLGYRNLPQLKIACSGQGVSGKKEEWASLGNGDRRLVEGMEALYDLFCQAPHLGSLIDPSQSGDLFAAGIRELEPLLQNALAQQIDDDFHSMSVAALDQSVAVRILARHYTLVATNVPYLSRQKWDDVLQGYVDGKFDQEKQDLANVMIERCSQLAGTHGTVAAVTPQGWLFATRYKRLRLKSLGAKTWNLLAKLGAGAFETISGEVVNVALLIWSPVSPSPEHMLCGLDVSCAGPVAEKQLALRASELVVDQQRKQLGNPDARIVFGHSTGRALLLEFADSRYGLRTADGPRFIRCFWEIPALDNPWVRHQSTVEETAEFGGREHCLFWQDGTGELQRFADLGLASLQGSDAWKKQGVIVSLMGQLPVTRYTGEFFDNNCAALWPKDQRNLSAVWAFCQSNEFAEEVRKLDGSIKVTNLTLLKVPFDIEKWTRVAKEQYPSGLPAPGGNDPTQWVFNGSVSCDSSGMQVLVGKLLGYEWPEAGQERSAHIDEDGIVPLSAVRGEKCAAERVGDFLRELVGLEGMNGMLRQLLTSADCKPGSSLEDWLRNAFFEQHCRLFHNRPFIWHIWDGRKDGFSCFVNYHKLSYKTLDNLTHSYLETWIKKQAGDVKTGKAGADLRLAAAQALQEKLKLILGGEPPYDIFVRWKPLHQQPIGWNPDLNDGVRVNIRPFVEAGVLRKNPNVKWTKDRGTEPERDRSDYPWFWNGDTFTGERVNDIHLSTAEKQAARNRKGVQ